jgi:hypothetical protein
MTERYNHSEGGSPNSVIWIALLLGIFIALMMLIAHWL